MEWQKTTFGELRAGDVFSGSIPDGRSGYDVLFLRNNGRLLEGTFTNNETVYRLVFRSPEREALAGRTPEQIAEALRLLDNREKVVEKLGSIINDEMFVTPRTRSMARAALALLQAEKEGKA